MSLRLVTLFWTLASTAPKKFRLQKIMNPDIDILALSPYAGPTRPRQMFRPRKDHIQERPYSRKTVRIHICSYPVLSVIQGLSKPTQGSLSVPHHCSICH